MFSVEVKNLGFLFIHIQNNLRCLAVNCLRLPSPMGLSSSIEFTIKGMVAKNKITSTDTVAKMLWSPVWRTLPVAVSLEHDYYLAYSIAGLES